MGSSHKHQGPVGTTAKPCWLVPPISNRDSALKRDSRYGISNGSIPGRNLCRRSEGFLSRILFGFALLALASLMLPGSGVQEPSLPSTPADTCGLSLDPQNLSSEVVQTRYRKALDQIVEEVPSEALNDEAVVEYLRANQELFERSRSATTWFAEAWPKLDAHGIWLDAQEVTRGMWFATYQLERLPQMVSGEPPHASPISNRLTNLYAVASEYSNQLTAGERNRLRLTNFESFRAGAKRRQGLAGEVDGFQQAFVGAQTAMRAARLRRAALLEALARTYFERIRLSVVVTRLGSMQAQ